MADPFLMLTPARRFRQARTARRSPWIEGI